MRRRLMLKNKSSEEEKLPEGYTRVQYLESNGNQRIILPNADVNDIHIECKTAVCGYMSTGESCLCGNVRLTANNGYLVGFLSEKFYAYSARSGNLLYSDVEKLNTVYAIKADFTSASKLLTVDGKTSVGIGNTNHYNEEVNYLFGRGTLMGDNTGYVGKVYYFKYRCGTTKLNLVPCLDVSNNPCMYDTINNVTYYNTKAGQFGYETLDGVYVAPR